MHHSRKHPNWKCQIQTAVGVTKDDRAYHLEVSLFCFLVCLGLMKSGWDFYLVEKEFGAPGFLNIHSAVWVFIIPFGMGLITLRFFNQLVIGFIEGELREPHRL
jgi:TRAP-type C4-dicarboxylate transport system permease small subunit